MQLIEARPEHFVALVAGDVPPDARSLAPSALAPVPVLEMLAALSARIGASHVPNAWMIVEQGTVAGLLTLVAEPAERAVTIGYGVAESHRGRGLASGAVRELLELLRHDQRVDAVLAETSTENPASQHVLRVNGFAETGQRTDPEDGPLICWRKSLG
ncbi:GNAT family N-acetyltransferase [Novosphingobium aquiterrae]|uniref:GNAT family N-acetyltransferase n=1 Tax=Novosphingobium aquiterrae TaxID=624388 RepID=A0ABV6PKJ7_9SPHN